jgi:hypothetical protein
LREAAFDLVGTILVGLDVNVVDRQVHALQGHAQAAGHGPIDLALEKRSMDGADRGQELRRDHDSLHLCKCGGDACAQGIKRPSGGRNIGETKADIQQCGKLHVLRDATGCVGQEEHR